MGITRRIVLASESPRRRRLLHWLGLPFDTISVDTPEELDTPLAADPQALATSLAVEKSLAARDEGHAEDALVLTFDTIVVLDGEVLGKPKDPDDARRMLAALSGRTHQVVTGVALLGAGESAPEAFEVTTDVEMLALDEARVREWMNRGEYLGCAGAYNIEGQIAAVTETECYQNVAGLPLCHVFAALNRPKRLATLPSRPVSPIPACDAALCRTCALGPRLLG